MLPYDITEKIVDLCQNPMTKEPKLVRARQIPEWDSYDQEVAGLAARVAEQGGQGLAGSVDELAGDKTAREVSSEAGQGDDIDAKHLVDEL